MPSAGLSEKTRERGAEKLAESRFGASRRRKDGKVWRSLGLDPPRSLVRKPCKQPVRDRARHGDVAAKMDCRAVFAARAVRLCSWSGRRVPIPVVRFLGNRVWRGSLSRSRRTAASTWALCLTQPATHQPLLLFGGSRAKRGSLRPGGPLLALSMRPTCARPRRSLNRHQVWPHASPRAHLRDLREAHVGDEPMGRVSEE
jgi:hypothetical protein